MAILYDLCGEYVGPGTTARSRRVRYFARLRRRDDSQKLLQGIVEILAERIVVIAAVHAEEALGLGGQGEELLAVNEGNDAVAVAVRDEDGTREIGRASCRERVYVLV